MTWRSHCLSNIQMTPSLGRTVNMLESQASIKRDLDRLEEQLNRNLLKFNKEKYKVQCLEKNNPLQPQKLGSCSTENAPWSQMDKELHKPAARPSSNKGHQHPGLHEQGHSQICQPKSASTFGPYNKRKTLINCSEFSGGTSRWSGTGALAVGLRPRKLDLFSLKKRWLQGEVNVGQSLSLEDFKTGLDKALSNLVRHHS